MWLEIEYNDNLLQTIPLFLLCFDCHWTSYDLFCVRSFGLICAMLTALLLLSNDGKVTTAIPMMMKTFQYSSNALTFHFHSEMLKIRNSRLFDCLTIWNLTGLDKLKITINVHFSAFYWNNEIREPRIECMQSTFCDVLWFQHDD